MARLEIPLLSRTLWRTGDVVLRAELNLSIKTNRGTWVEAPFLVDSGTEMTCLPASEAKKLDLPIPRQPVGAARSGRPARTSGQACSGHGSSAWTQPSTSSP